MSSADKIRYASAPQVLRALDKDPSTVEDYLHDRARERAAAATQKWINRTGQAFHEHRIGDAADPRTWEVYDSTDATSWDPATIILDGQSPLPIDGDADDAIELRDGRDSWDDITGEEGDTWTFDARRRRLTLYTRRLGIHPYDDPDDRVVRLTYRIGPLGETVDMVSDGLVQSAPADVAQAVAAKAASMLALDDDASTSVPDNGQLTPRSAKRQALNDTYDDTAAEYSGFSTF